MGDLISCYAQPSTSCLLDLDEVEDIRNLEIRPIQQNQVATDHDVRVIRRWGWEHPFNIRWATLHFLLKPRRATQV